MKTLLKRLFLVLLALMLLAVGDLYFNDNMDLNDAVFATVMLVAAGEPANIDVASISPLSQTLLAVVTVGGVVLIAVLFAFLADRVLAIRLEYVLGKRGIPKMKGHIVLVGLGQVGWRVLEALQAFDRPVMVVERDAQNTHVDAARRLGASVIVEDPRHADTLAKAHVADAHAIICCTDNDLSNLEVALDAREQNPGIRVVLRMYDQQLAAKLGGAFDIQIAFSSSALAAPAFASAAIDRTIVNSFFLDSLQVITVRLSVVAGSRLTALSTFDLEHQFDCALLKHRPAGCESILHPKEARPIGAGDVLMVNTTFDQLDALKAAAGDTQS